MIVTASHGHIITISKSSLLAFHKQSQWESLPGMLQVTPATFSPKGPCTLCHTHSAAPPLQPICIPQHHSTLSTACMH